MISAGVATFGSTLTCEQVKPRSVHSDVVCDPASSCARHQCHRIFVDDDGVVGHEWPTPMA
jgi:hypothetical protein